MKPVRVLYVSGGSLDRGGIASWMLNYAAQFDRKEVAVDFVVHGVEPGAREAEALALGAKVYHVPYRGKNPAENRAKITEAIGAGYDIVHAHMDGMNAYPLGIARALGVPIRISHCHNTNFLTANPLRRAMHSLAKRQIPKCATHLFACSEAAGRFLYGDKRFNAGDVMLVRNAIEIERYRFDPTARARLRAELGLEGRFAIGHIGRFDLHQKNQLFLLNVFHEAKLTRKDLALVLVGDGADRGAIEAYRSQFGLERDVVLTGFREDIPALLSVFDLFALPSRFEGLGIVLIEAQASGLDCLASDGVPRDTEITHCRYLSLNDKQSWVKKLTDAKENVCRVFPQAELIAQGYEIIAAAEQLQLFYRKAAGRI